MALVAATALVAAAGLTGSAPAYAAPCSSDTGVTVVVDFHELGGGLQQVCDPGGGGQRASALFPDNGYPLTYVQRQPGFVCRVSGAPAEDPCVNTPPANAYWGLWWSDGESGTWSYSSAGVGSLSIPAGGSVALSWNGSSTKSPPGAPAPRHETAEEPTEEPQPTAEPTTRPSQPPTPGGGTAGGGTAGGGPAGGGASSSAPSGSATASPKARDRQDDAAPRDRPSDRRQRDGHDRDRGDRTGAPSVAPSAPASDDAESVAEPPASGEDAALPVWVGPTAVGGLLAVAGVATYLRRRAS